MTLAQLAARARVRWGQAASRVASGAVFVAVVNVGPAEAIHRLVLCSVRAERAADLQLPASLRLFAAPPDEGVRPVDWEMLCLELDYLLALGLPDDTRVRVTAMAGAGDPRREEVALLAITEQPDAALVCTRDRRNLDTPWPLCEHSPAAHGHGTEPRTSVFAGGGETESAPTAPLAPADPCPCELLRPAVTPARDTEVFDTASDLATAQALWAATDSESSFQRALAHLNGVLADLGPRLPSGVPPVRLQLPAARHVDPAAVARLLATARQLAAVPEPDHTRLQELVHLISACFGDGSPRRFERW